MFEFGSHALQHPDVVYNSTISLRTQTVDGIVFGDSRVDPKLCDGLVIDVQGAEFKVLRGALRVLAQSGFVFTEVSEGGVYRGDVSLEVLIDFLRRQGFRLRNLDLNRHGWGNALFIR
jgi:hypothetical protein